LEYLAERELGRLVAAVGAVELPSVGDGAAVVDADLVGGHGAGPVAFLQRTVDEAGGRHDGARLTGGHGGGIGLGPYRLRGGEGEQGAAEGESHARCCEWMRRTSSPRRRHCAAAACNGAAAAAPCHACAP